MAYEIIKRPGSNFSGFGDWQQSLTSVGLNPQEALAKARAGAASYSDKLKAQAYEYFYLQGRDLLVRVANDPTVQRIGAIAGTGYDLVGASQGLIKQLKNARLDASGIMDSTNAVLSYMGSINKFVVAVGGNPQIVQQVSAWVGTGGSCATGIAAAGPIIGGIACALQVVTQLFSSMFSSESIELPPGYEPRAVFIPSIKQQALVQSDALRLAAVLKSYYGFMDMTPIVERANAYTYMTLREAYPTQPPVRDGKFDFNDPAWEGKPIPAVEPHIALTILSDPDLDRDSARMRVGDALQAMGEVMSVFEPYLDRKPRALYEYFDGLHDINVETITTAAAIGRRYVGDTGWGLYPGTAQKPIDFLPFVRLDELLNYFVAVILRERALGVFNETDFSSLPVRLWAVTRAGKRYSSLRWTNLFPGESATTVVPPNEDPNSFLARINRGELSALKEFAMQRLMAAFSQLILLKRWGQADPIVDFKPTQFNIPIDPRQVIPEWTVAARLTKPDDTPAILARVGAFEAAAGSANQTVWDLNNPPALNAARDGVWLAARIADAERNFQELMRNAYNAAINDHTSIMIAKLASRSGGVVASTAASGLAAAVKSGQVVVQTKVQAAQACEAAGGVPRWGKTDDGRDKLFCEPPKPAAAVAAPLLLAGAALLALKFLK